MTPRAPHGGGDRPIPEKTQGWLWGFLCGSLFDAIVGAAVTAYLMWG